MGPEGTPLTVVKVEDTGADAWASVAAIDRGEDDSAGAGAAAPGRAALLAGGDLAALLAFAAVGRASHGEPLDPASLLATAGPFLAAWFPAALALGGYSARAAGGGGDGGGGPGGAAVAALKVWAVAVPLGIAIRSVARGYAPPNVFVAVTLGVTLVAMVGWRAALAALAPPPPASAAAGGGAAASPEQRLAARGDRRGGPMELVQVIMSLTKRW